MRNKITKQISIKITRVPEKDIHLVEKKIGSFCKILQDRRMEINKTQEQLAEMLDISVIGLRQIETGKRAPSLQLLIRLCKKLKLNLDITAE